MKPFARVADQDRAAEFVEATAMGHQRQVMLVRLAKADAGIEADPLALDAGSEQGVAALGRGT